MIQTTIIMSHLQRIYWSILIITADQLQKTVYGIWILTIPQQIQIRDLKQEDCSPKRGKRCQCNNSIEQILVF